MDKWEFRVVAVPLNKLELTLNEQGLDGWGIAWMHSEAGFMHVVFYRRKQQFG